MAGLSPAGGPHTGEPSLPGTATRTGGRVGDPAAGGPADLELPLLGRGRPLPSHAPGLNTLISFSAYSCDFASGSLITEEVFVFNVLPYLPPGESRREGGPDGPAYHWDSVGDAVPAVNDDPSERALTHLPRRPGGRQGQHRLL